MWKPFFSRAWPLVVFVAVLAACSGDEPSSVSEAQRQAVQAAESADQEDTQARSAAQSMARAAERDQAAESIEQPAGQDEEPPPAERSTEEEDAQASDPPSSEAAATPAQTASEEVEPADGEPAADLTDVPGVVLADVDVRVRPGLAWPAIDRLEVGASVVVLHGAGGWYRVRYGGELEGWIRSNAVDLGDIDERAVLQQPAPPILAKWRGVEYEVMGQSADATEVRLLRTDDEPSEIINAPRDEVRLLVEDVTLDDLPILLGDETVVFPGDDFRVGQGRILPKANEWMWLPWGWLLAHNDEYIWQWRPETDELEFIRRPPGFAKLSPDGQYLAIANLCPRDLDCSRDNDVLFIPLDGSSRIAFSEELRNFEVAPTLGIRSNRWVSNLVWSGNSRAVKLQQALFDKDREPNAPTTLLYHIEGHVVRFEEFWSRELQGSSCHVEMPVPGSGNFGGWEFHDHDTIAIIANCVDADGDRDFRAAVFTLTGEFIRLDPAWPELITDEDAAQLRSAVGGDALGERIHVEWSPSRQHGIVIESPTVRVWLYRAREHDLRAVVVPTSQSATEWQPWPVIDPDHGLEGWICCQVYWSNDKRAAIFALWYVYTHLRIHGAIALNLSTGEGSELEITGSVQASGWRSGTWDPRGESFQVAVGETRHAEVQVDRPNLHPLLIFRPDGSLRSALITSTGCRLLDAWGQVPRHRADWSPDGKWFVVGGHDPGGLYTCPLGE